MRWTISKITQTFACSLITGFVAATLSATTVANPADVRVLVDVSGSMKTADPKAVRGPATALLAALLPDQSQGGIWLFGSDVRELVPYGPVDARWNALGQPIEDLLAQLIASHTWRALSALASRQAANKRQALVMSFSLLTELLMCKVAKTLQALHEIGF